MRTLAKSNKTSNEGDKTRKLYSRAENLRDSIDYIFKLRPDLSETQLASLTDIHKSTINHWRTLYSFPTGALLAKFADGVSKLLNTSITTDWLLGPHTTDTFQNIVFKMPQLEVKEYEELRDRTMASANRALWMQFRVGTDLSATLHVIDEVLRKPSIVQVRLLLPDPKSRSLMRILAQSRYHEKKRTLRATAKDITSTVETLEAMADTAGVLKNLDIRYIEYLMPSIAYIADPETETGTVFSALSSYRGFYREAPILVIPRYVNQELFLYFENQFKSMWADARLSHGTET